MAQGINIGVAADTRAYSQAVKQGLVEPTEDAQAAIKELADTGTRDGAQLERAMRDQQRATETNAKEYQTLTREVKEGAREQARAAKQAGKSVGDDMKRGTHEAEEGVKTLKENTASNLKEVAASFDGTASGIASGFQGLAAEIAEGFGPAGLLAGAVVAGGIGLISTGLEGAQEDADKVKERISQLAQQLVDLKTTAPNVDIIVQKLKDLATEADDNATSLGKLRKVADDARSDYKSLAQAYSGNEDELDRLLDTTRKSYQALQDRTRAAQQANSTEQDAYGPLIKRQVALRKQLGLLEQTKGELTAAAQKQKDYAESGGPEMEAKAAAIKRVNDAYDDAAGDIDDFIDKESGVLDVSRYIAAMAAREQALRDYRDTLATSDISPQAKTYIEGLGTEQAAAMLAGYKHASKHQQAELDRIWTEAGKSNSGAYLDQMNDLAGKTVNGPKVKQSKVPAPDMSAFYNAMNVAARAGAIGIAVNVKPQTGKALH